MHSNQAELSIEIDDFKNVLYFIFQTFVRAKRIVTTFHNPTGLQCNEVCNQSWEDAHTIGLNPESSRF